MLIVEVLFHNDLRRDFPKKQRLPAQVSSMPTILWPDACSLGMSLSVIASQWACPSQ